MPYLIVVALKWVLAPLALVAAAVFGVLGYLRHGGSVQYLVLVRAGFIACLCLLLFLPAMHRSRTQSERPELRVVLDASRSMTLSDGQRRSRMERAQERVSTLLRTYGDSFTFSSWTFGTGARLVVDPGTATATESTSDLTGALQAVTTSADPERVRGIFLLTDGAHTSAGSPVPWARTSPCPVFTVGLGSEAYPYKDLTIVRVDAPEVAFKDSALSLTAHLKAVGFSPKERMVVSLQLGEKAVSEKTVDLSSGTATVRFTLKPEKAGLNIYRVKLPQVPDELSSSNNTRAVPVMVEEKPRDLLLISGQPTWETAFLRRAIAADPRFALKSMELSQKGKVQEFSALDLSKARMVILNRFDPSDFHEGQIQLLVDYVQKGEGALLLLGTAPEDVDPLMTSDLAKILPVGRPDGRLEGIRRMNLVLTPQGARHPACTVLSHPQANLLAWKNLPPLMPTAMFPVSGGEGLAATTLATFPYYPRDVVGIAYRFFGRGLTVFVNTAETHLLKLLPAAADDRDQVYPSFVANLLDWMTDQGRSAGVGLTLARLRFSQGEAVDVGVNDYQGLLEGSDLALTIKKDGTEQPRTIRLARTEDGINGRFTPEEPGTYRISLAVPGKGTVEKVILVQEDSRELENPFANLEILKELASVSGGAFFAESDANLGRLALNAAPMVRTFQSHLVWVDQWKLMVTMLAFLCTEWILRRRRRMV